MRRLLITTACLAWSCVSALAVYEVTAKADEMFGLGLPGWQACRLAENRTAWNPPTGILPVDKLLHEGEEAVRFYRLRAGATYQP